MLCAHFLRAACWRRLIHALKTEIVARAVFAESLSRLQIIRIETLRGSGDTPAA
jgi:hypothetical protein